MALLSRVALLAGLCGTVGGVRMTTGKSRTDVAVADVESINTKYIEGVPVYNYHIAFQQDRAHSFLQLVKGDAGDDPLREHWIISILDGVSDAQIAETCGQHPQCKYGGHSGGVPFMEFQGTERELAEFLKEKRGMVKFVEPDMPTFRIPEVPADDAASSLAQDVASGEEQQFVWGLERIGVAKRRTTGKGVHIYVFDSGIRFTHQDFGGRAVAGFDATLATPRPCRAGDKFCSFDRQGHGTHCAGTAGGTTYGVAPDATIHSVKVLSDEGPGSGSWVLMGLDWVINSGQRPAVASMSLGMRGNSVGDRTAIDRAVSNGVVVVVAAGNDAQNACQFTPAFVPSAITVGSTDNRDSLSSFSNWGSCVGIFAPGNNIASASQMADTQSALMSGTSMACPHVSGAAALLLESNPTWTPAQVLSALQNAAFTDVVRGSLRGAANRLLRVDNLPGPGGVPAPAPPPAPVVAPTPAPFVVRCPSWASTPVADRLGNCMCAGAAFCSTNGRTRDCFWNGGVFADSGPTGGVFHHTCPTCRCWTMR